MKQIEIFVNVVQLHYFYFAKCSVQMQAGMAPSARIIAYYILGDSSKELVADSLNFNVEGAFDKNQVQKMS